ncbi:MAG: hypothetical protein CMH61_00415 [Nanoarchaeota archaeon]|nr:hypothetical protein [Nanoarchaeota archaeon]
MENIRIGVIGNIGAGKSDFVTTAKKSPIDELLLDIFPTRNGQEKVHSFHEQYTPEVLDAFYEDPEKWAFMAQIEFLNGRLERQPLIENSRGIVLEDRTLAEDFHVFGKAQKILGRMTNEEFLTYDRTFRLMTDKFGEPDMVVYLRADVNSLQKRIKKRGRPSERKVTDAYLTLLNDLYEDFFDTLDCPKTVVNVNEYADDDKALQAHFVRVIQQVANRMKSFDLRVATPGLSDWVRAPRKEATIRAIEAERQLEDYLASHPKFIDISGLVARGKSSLARIMERSLRINALYENPLENPLLEKFLADKATHAFDLQMHFKEMRARYRLEGVASGESYVNDRSFAEDILVFSRQLHEEGYLTDGQLDLLKVEFKKTSDLIPQADLLVALQGSPEFSWKHIHLRGIPMEIEGGWTFPQIQALHRWDSSYPEDVRKQGYHRGPVLKVNAEILDITSRIHGGYVFEQMYKMLTE